MQRTAGALQRRHNLASRLNTEECELQFLARLAEAPTGRRKFLTWSGITLAVAAVGCAEESSEPTTPLSPGLGAGGPKDGPCVQLGQGDVLVLNFAYALEQLEAAFYIKIVESPYAGITSEESHVLTSVKQHEVVHREFFREALGPAAIPTLEFDFTSIDFGSRQSVLTAARAFEDTGVSAYNGAAKYLENLDFLLTAGKIVSVEARHAAAIRSLLRPKTGYFAGDDVVNEQGLDIVAAPRAVFRAVDPLITTCIDGSDLPNA